MTQEEKLNRKAVGYSLAIRDIMILHGAKKESAETIAKTIQIAYLAGAAEADVTTMKGAAKEDAEHYLPELAESEDDRIRKALIRFHKSTIDVDGIKGEDIIAWLEKQGKQKSLSITDEWIEDYWQHEKVNNPYSYDKGEEIQFDHQGFVRFCKKYCKGEKKPADKVEPKFHEGDWVVSPNGVYWHIDKISNNRYEVTSNTGESSDWPLDTNIYHRFSIQDAKGGDVLATKAGGIFIYKELLYDKPFAYCGVDKFGVFKDCNYGDGLDWTPYLSDVTPATKEQRDLLFQKMKEAGYEWDSGRKELKKHTPKHKVGDTIYYNSFGEVKNMIVANVTTDGTDNPVYEDENGNAVFEKDLIEQTWSKPGHKQGWSKEDEKYWSIVIAEFSKCVGKSVSKDEWMRCNDWLNSLRDRVQPVQEWSEEDENIISNAEVWLDTLCDYLKDSSSAYIPDVRVIISKLKSLRPQAQWKPSDKQIYALRSVVTELKHSDNKYQEIIEDLYQDLEKLREE